MRCHPPCDLNGLTKLMVFGRVLNPKSKAGTYEGRKGYAFQVTDCENRIEIYRALDVLNEKADAIQMRMNHKIRQAIGRNTDICFYDVTNYYFEIGENDEDEYDASGKLVREGLRKRGPSKEKRSEPIVQMGLFIDDNGIPIAYHLFSGNHTDQTTLRPALKKSIDKLNYGRVIIVADGGLNSNKNIAHTQTLLSIDMDKVSEYSAYMGYYTLVTSETERTDQEIIHKYHGLSRIEDSFRITKSDLEGRPVYLSTPEHINAHFLVCFMALTMIRLIQFRILNDQGKDTLNEDGWESGLTADRIQQALAGFQADALPGGYYRISKPSDDLRLIFDAFGIPLDLRLPSVSDLRQFKYRIAKSPLM